MYNELDLAYIAGLFDGEGHCRIGRYQATKNGKVYYRAIANITNTDKSVLEFVQKLYGLGSIQTSDFRPPKKIVYRWVLSHGQARQFLKSIQPYARIKREQIAKVLAD